MSIYPLSSSTTISGSIRPVGAGSPALRTHPSSRPIRRYPAWTTCTQAGPIRDEFFNAFELEADELSIADGSREAVIDSVSLARPCPLVPATGLCGTVTCDSSMDEDEILGE